MSVCPICDGPVHWRHNGVWCDRCHRKVETCCEGAPQTLGADGAAVCAGQGPPGDRANSW